MNALSVPFLVISVYVLPAIAAAAATPANSAIDYANQELKLSEAQRNELQDVAENEAIRIAYHPDRAASPLVQARLYDRRYEAIDLGDGKVLLRIRLVELQRRLLQKALEANRRLYLPCSGAAPDISQWIDAGTRKKAATWLECRRGHVDEFEAATTQLSPDSDRMIRQLHLPAAIQDSWLKTSGSTDISSMSAKGIVTLRAQLNAFSELLKFMDSREGKMALENGQITFSDPEDVARAQSLLSRIQESSHLSK